MVLYAYVRNGYPVSIMDQLGMLTSCDCEEVFIEDGNIMVTNEQDRLLGILEPDDQLLVYDLKVFAKTTKAFKVLLEKLIAANIRLISIEDKLDTAIMTSFYSNAMIVLSMDESYRKQAVHLQMQHAKLQGRVVGRPRVATSIIEEILFLFEQKNMSMREIAETCHVSLGTVHKYVTANKVVSEDR